MSTIAYFVFGMLDILAIVSITLKMYKLPFLKHLTKIITLMVIMTVISYLLREQWGVPQLDVPLQYVQFVLFFTFFIKQRFHIAAFICAAGYSVFISLQMAVFLIFNIFGIADLTVTTDNTGLINFIQAFTEILCFLIALFLWFTRNGFSFVETTQHQLDKPMFIQGLISGATLCITLVLLYSGKLLSVIVLVGINFIISYLLSHKRIDDDSRGAFEAYIEGRCEK